MTGLTNEGGGILLQKYDRIVTEMNLSIFDNLD